MPPTRRPAPGRRKGAGEADIQRYLRVAAARNRASKTVKEDRSRLLSEALVFKNTMTCLLAELFTSAHEDAEIAQELLRACRHLFEGGSVNTLPLRLISRKRFLARVEAVISGRQLVLDDEDDPT